VETPGEYPFLLDVPGLSKSDIQVRRRPRRATRRFSYRAARIDA